MPAQASSRFTRPSKYTSQSSPTTPTSNTTSNATKIIKSRIEYASRRHSLADHGQYFALPMIGVVAAVVVWHKPTVAGTIAAIRDLPLGLQILAIASMVVAVQVVAKAGRPYALFAWNCFVRPFLEARKQPGGIDSEDHQRRLELFYEGQADVYDVTRRRLLRGRSTMLKLCAAQLRQYYPCDFTCGETQVESPLDPPPVPSPRLGPTPPTVQEKRFAWIDIGGGTGENIERMNAYFPICNFSRVYVVDITPSLCEIARKRFERLGWTNVRVLCMDACKFDIPKEDGPEDLEIALITMSYSLSMMESFYPLIDRLSEVLSPTGIFGVTDFFVSSKRSGDPTRQLSWLMRWFWAIWFDLDNIYLNPARREYLEHKFRTVKALNLHNAMFYPLIKIPYYVWLGAKEDPSFAGLRLDSETLLDDFAVLSDDEDEGVGMREGEEDGECLDTLEGLHVRSDHVHGQGMRWRQPFDLDLISRFATYIYAFSWEDPQMDLKVMDLRPEDRMLAITSGGCNVLEYAAEVGPARLHAVDLNPCQNNLLELKMAGIAGLEYQDFWRLFGEGYLPKFSTYLDTHLSPYLSPYAYHFWKQNANFTNFFKTGCTGLAIRVLRFIMKIRGLRDAIERMCGADTIEEQRVIWEKEIRPHFLSPWLIRILNNDRFLWGALGVPPAQMQMLLKEGSVYDYAVKTLDPVIQNSHIKSSNYFYYLPLMERYHPSCTPAYLSERGFTTLQSNPSRLDAIQIHTDVILNVLNNKVEDGELTKVMLMDHLDWFAEEDADAEIEAVSRKLCKGGKAFWRSAGRRPWYNRIFESRGFKVTALQARDEETEYLDRVNMYASLWCGEKL
ncbi:hypothetical protein HK104_008851 [Borealophlyctis nickersoniae]|nr:hypothetical protein HK104_008851 [Borealophlyctis nickersoniae]